MTAFYRDSLGMREREHDSKDSLHEFVDFGTEIHLERVETRDQHELLGSLELYSSDPDGLSSFLSKKGVLPVKRSVSGKTELVFSDPDGYVVTIIQRAR